MNELICVGFAGVYKVFIVPDGMYEYIPKGYFLAGEGTAVSKWGIALEYRILFEEKNDSQLLPIGGMKLAFPYDYVGDYEKVLEMADEQWKVYASRGQLWSK